MKFKIMLTMYIVCSSMTFADTANLTEDFFRIIDINGNLYFIGQEIDEVMEVLGEPNNTSIIYQHPTKPEFSRIRWEYKIGISLEFLQGFRTIESIVISNSIFCTEQGLLKPLANDFSEILIVYGDGYNLIENISDNILLYTIPIYESEDELFSFFSYNISFQVKDQKGNENLISEISIFRTNAN